MPKSPGFLIIITHRAVTNILVVCTMLIGVSSVVVILFFHHNYTMYVPYG
ncbi:MAG: hypothetical protein LBI26_01825 [Holosporales bacterium]|nr:hypothetical protein [Holosporales bacterium]